MREENKTIVQKINLEAHYSIPKLMTYPQFKRFVQNPNDIKTFQENLLHFLRKKYGNYNIFTACFLCFNFKNIAPKGYVS